MGNNSASRAIALAVTIVTVALFTGLMRYLAPAATLRFLQRLRSESVLVPASIGVLAILAVILATYAVYPGYLDQAEPSLVSVSWLVRQGAPLYHSLDNGDRYTLLYGPSCFLPYAASYFVFGGSAFAAKLVVIVADALTVFLLFRTFRALLDPSKSLIAVALLLAVAHALRPNDYFLQLRGDPLIICASVLALFGATRRAGVMGLLALAVGGGFVIDSKVTGVIYLLPLLVMVIEARGWSLAIGVSLAMLGVAGLPFLLPNVSYARYTEWLHLATGHPWSMKDLRATLLAFPVLAAPLPLIIGVTPWRDARIVAYVRSNISRILCILVSLSLVTVVSARIGAGSHHLLPLMPLLAYEFARLYVLTMSQDAMPRTFLYGLLWCCVALIVLARVGGGLREVLQPFTRWAWASSVSREVRVALARYGPRQLQMGYGDRNDRISQYRTDITFAANRLMLDAQAIADMDLDGVKLPRSTIAACAACAAEAWLIPKGQQPFALNNVFGEIYPISRQPLFSQDFRDTFAKHYHKAESLEYFDVWSCNEAEAASR